MTLAPLDLVPGDLAELERERADAERRRLGELIRDLLPEMRHERERLDRIDGWARWDPEQVKLPQGATPELRALREMARAPWLGLVVTSTAQCMYVDGWHAGSGEELEPVEASDGKPTRVVRPKSQSRQWQVWEANDMASKQVALHRSMLTYGYSFATALPGGRGHGDPEDAERVAVIRGYSPRKMQAWYDDPANDEWPVIALELLSRTETTTRVRLYDDTHVRTIRVKETIAADGSPDIVIEKQVEHGAGVCPVVRYCNQLDLDGRTPGEVEPHIPVAARINKTSYDRMLVQHYNSWKVRTVTGMSPPDVKEEKNRAKLQLRQDDILIAEDPDTKFGTLDETQLGGFISAKEADVEELAAVTQTPTHELTGKLINVSAEGLAMIRASQQAKASERQASAGRSHAQLLRLCCHIEGDAEAAADFTGRVTWQDTSIRSMAQAVDALGKGVQMLGIPAQGVWGRIPGVDKTDVEEWVRLAAALDPVERMRAELARQETADAAMRARGADPAGGGDKPATTPPPKPVAAKPPPK